jgi:hypothetical protein
LYSFIYFYILKTLTSFTILTNTKWRDITKNKDGVLGRKLRGKPWVSPNKIDRLFSSFMKIIQIKTERSINNNVASCFQQQVQGGQG